MVQRAYREWPLFSTFIDNIEMSIAKTDGRIAKMYLALGDRADLAHTVYDEMMLTRRWVRAVLDELAAEAKAAYLALIQSTVTGVSAGLQNTG